MTLQEVFGGFAAKLLQLLPQSPFRSFMALDLSDDALRGLRWLNWLVPVPQIIAVLQAWLVAIAVFYLYSVIARWVKLIGD